jgi:ribosome-associated toxin RatA of RatAB toxin-antitoxin module
MATVTVTQKVNASAKDTWAAWDDFANINAFNPNIQKSFLINDSDATGLGAQRRCDLADGKNHILERIIQYSPGQKMVIDIYEGTLPMKQAIATISVAPLGAQTSKVTMSMEFEPKFGLIGRMMIPMMKPQIKGMLAKLLKGNAEYVESTCRMRLVA